MTPSSATLLTDFSNIFQSQFEKLHENEEDANDVIMDLLGKMKEEDRKATSSDKNQVLLFFISNQVASILDNLDTWEAMTGRTNVKFVNAIPFDLDRQTHDPTSIIPQYIKKIRKSSPLDSYRRKFFARMRYYSDKLTTENILQNRGKIYSITAPCGIGKTLGILYLALRLQLLSQNAFGFVPKVIYALPFISICDQVEETAKDLLGLTGTGQTKTLTIHHHLADFGLSVYRITKESEKDDNSETENEAALSGITDYEIEMWRSDLIITSSVRLFETIFRLSKNNVLRFNRLVNSIIILDEYHSIPLKYHDAIHAAMLVLSRYFNTQFIVATATTPAIFKPEELIEIIPNQATFFAGINRYRIEFSPTKISELNFNQRMVNLVNDEAFKSKSIMIVVNTKPRCRKLFRFLSPQVDRSIRPVYHLSGNVLPADRKDRLNLIRNDLDDGKAPILVTTQLIEAGIDVSFDHIIRDIGPLSSIVQVAGRCNRNAKMEEIPVVEIVHIEDDSGIYDGGSIQVTAKLFKELERNQMKQRFVIDIWIMLGC